MKSGGSQDGSGPVPNAGHEESRGTLLYLLDVDGEVFSVTARAGGTDYGWLSGPNKDYGFSSSWSADRPEEEHRRSIQEFLGMIDPATGYLPDD